LLAAPSAADVLVLDAAKDNTLYEDNAGTLSNGIGEYVFTGVTAVSSIRRAVMQFDVAGAVPAGSTIESVRLVLQMNMTIASAQDVSLHEALEDWGEGTSDAPGQEGAGTTSTANDATWIHTYFPGSLWTTAGGEFDPTASATISVKSDGRYTWGSTAAMVADAQGWLDTPASNFGWVIKHDDEATATTAKRYASRENIVAQVRPRLEIGFAPPGGCPTIPYCIANPNSTGVSARIYAVGDCSIAANNFTLISQPVPNQSAIFFLGNSQLQVPFGDGFLCAGGGVKRLLPPTTASANVVTKVVNLIGAGIVPSTKNIQCWYRDPMGAGGSGYNTPDGMQVTFVP
jgi:hypothetical protein